MSHQPSRPPPFPGYPSQQPQGTAPYEASEHGYTSPEISPSFLTATVIPSVDDDDAQTVSHTTHDADSLRTPSATPASAMQATVFGVQRVSPAPAGLAPPSLGRAAPAMPVAQHVTPAVRTSPPARPPIAASPAAPNGLSAAAAALADEPTGFLRVSDMPSAPAPQSARPATNAGPNWLADQPTSWVALQPGPSETANSGYAGGGATGTALRHHGSPAASAAALAAGPPSSLRPWLLSLGIGLLGGLLALVLIVAAMRYLSSNKGGAADRRSAATDRVSGSAGSALPAAALDDALRSVQRGDIDRAIEIVKAARSREPNPALDSLLESLKRVRGQRQP